MRRALTLALGVLIGQWLAFATVPAPSDFYRLGVAAWDRQEYAEALRLWSQGITLQPDNALLHYRRATALERLGQRHSAADAYRLTLLLGPPASIAHLVQEDLQRLETESFALSDTETAVVVEPARGVWVAPVVVNGTREARFLVDTGSSVTIVAPALASAMRLPTGQGGPVELQTVGGHTAGPTAIVASLRVGGAELRDVPVVVHEPGPGLDGILGNTVLGRYRLTIDPDRRLLHLRR
jgi:hypothetical protein